MAYLDDITALGPGHVYTFDGVFTDSVGTLNATNSGMATNGSPLCEGAANSCFSNGTGDRATLATAADVDGALSQKAVCGWLMVNSVQFPPKSIYREGTTGNQYNITMWAGNSLMLELVNSSSVF